MSNIFPKTPFNCSLCVKPLFVYGVTGTGQYKLSCEDCWQKYEVPVNDYYKTKDEKEIEGMNESVVILRNKRTDDGGFTNEFCCDFCDSPGTYRAYLPKTGIKVCKTCLFSVINEIDKEIITDCSKQRMEG